MKWRKWKDPGFTHGSIPADVFLDNCSSSLLLNPPTMNQSVGAMTSEGTCNSDIPYCSSFSHCFCKRLFSKISQNSQLTLARVFISIKNDTHISGRWIHSIKCSKGLFRKNSKWQLRYFTSTWVSTSNIMKKKIGDRGFSYSKMKSNFWSNSMLSNFTNQLAYKAHALGRGTPFLTMK